MKLCVYTGNLSRWGEERYRMLKGLGYDCVDFGMSDTETEPYTLDENAFIEYLQEERKLIEDAGMGVFQVHGPWRWPPEDSTPENRAERMEKIV